ncbi:MULTISPECIES: hypothetical protein [Luteimonas]|uniref:hypothetical protein n=1 Tax=Luteimonas TaxID=83614 RepID=UPI000C7C3E38|nr:MULTISPECIES: hypothetical protein [Luteimonas]
MRHRSGATSPTALLARWLLASVFLVLGGSRLWIAVEGATVPDAALAFSVAECVLGLVIASGWRLSWTASTAAALLLVDAVVSHPFWTLDAAARDGQLLHFMKNAGLVGGFLLLAQSAPRRR